MNDKFVVIHPWICVVELILLALLKIKSFKTKIYELINNN